MKRLKNCPYLKIKEIEEMIERERQILSYMRLETAKYEKALKEADIKMLYKLEKSYYDGFGWSNRISANLGLEMPLIIEKLRDQQEIPKKCQACPYGAKNCQDLLIFKKSRVSFFRKKIRQATSYYNGMTQLLNIMLNEHIKYAHQKEDWFIMFDADPRLSLIYFNIESFKPSEKGHYAVRLLYQDEKALEIRQEQIEYEYEVTSQILKGTYLMDGNQNLKLIKVYLPNETIKGVEKEVMHAINVLLKRLNKRFGRRYGQIQGAYIELDNYSISYKMQLINLLEPLGYKVLGRISSRGRFEEKRLLLYLCRSSDKGLI